MSLQQTSRSRPETRKSSRPAEFKQAKQLTARADYQLNRMGWMRVQRDYFSPYACRQSRRLALAMRQSPPPSR